ncbi:hypothetical protein DFH94DRAFT_107877 [Russula ochroleuca]|jgi:hypothetical protein|uniref:Uncharacterized protein n=1 Tax=Russula ochroleuca TaxID=152965 RepID=A0A9P5T611_9AGAM|nr:hypothetical protein DFH94DRAFT_107877 [Russula ochroleuca]
MQCPLPPTLTTLPPPSPLPTGLTADPMSTPRRWVPTPAPPSPPRVWELGPRAAEARLANHPSRPYRRSPRASDVLKDVVDKARLVPESTLESASASASSSSTPAHRVLSAVWCVGGLSHLYVHYHLSRELISRSLSFFLPVPCAPRMYESMKGREICRR